MATLLSVFASYTEIMIKSSPMANDFTAAAALYLLVIFLVLAQFPLRLLARRFAFTAGEIVTVYVMMLVAAGIPTRGLVEFIGPVVTSASYYATDANRWNDILLPWLRRAPWIGPQDAQVIRDYYTGLPPGAPIPWAAWLLPGFMWLLFCLAMSMAMISAAVILRRQWMDTERLVYPMMQPPIEIIRSSTPGARRPLWRSQLLWIGAAIPFVLFSLKALSHPDYLGSIIPPFQTNVYTRLLERMIILEFRFSPITLGFLYFVRMDVLLGLWAGSLSLTCFYGFLRFLGALPNLPKIGVWSYDTTRAFTGAGALIVFMAVVIWRSRRHIRAVISAVWRKGESSDSREEILSYRAAVLLLAVCVLFMAGWLVATGLAWWQAAAFIALAGLIFAALTRVVAEAGVPTAMTPVCAGDFMVGLFGSTAFTPQQLAGLGLTYPFHSEMRTSVMALAANGLKVFHETVRHKRRRLMWGLLAAVTLSYLAAMILTIYYPYERGGLNLDDFTFRSAAQYPWTDAVRRVENPFGPIWTGCAWMAGGGALMASLLAACQYVPGWPLHPIGLIISFHWAGRCLFSSALFMWIIKGLLLKYGGPWLYRGVRPFFIGLALGEVFTAGLWATIDVFTHVQRNAITSLF